jgi:hypothetical protein
MTAAVLRRALAPALAAVVAAACGGRFEGGGHLRAQKVVLLREVEGLREVVARLERGEPMLPVDDVAIGIEDTLVRDLIAAQLPFDADVDRYHLSLKAAEVHFRGSPAVRLRGVLTPRERPDLAAEVNVLGALERIEEIDRSSSTLEVRIAVDHIVIEKAAGLESFLSGAALDELARIVRLKIQEKLPPVQVPVRVQESIELPAVTTGPVRIDGARMPLQVAVSQVVAGQGTLWISVHLQPGDLVKTADAPAAGDAKASDAGVSLGADDEVGPPGAKSTRKEK